MKTMFATTLLALAAAGSTLSSDAHASGSAVSPAALAQAMQIDEALLSSRLTVFGVESSYRRDLAGRPRIDEVIACSDAKLRPWFQQQYATAIASALTAQELSQGAQLAAQVPTKALAGYIDSHVMALDAEARTAHAREEDYFLATTASRLGRPAAELAAIQRFIAWHRQIGVRVDAAARAPSQTHAYGEEALAVLKECVASVK